MFKAMERGNAYNELMQELQQQYLVCPEQTSLKLQKVEQLMEIAVQ